MPIRASRHFKVPPEKFDRLRAFNPFLDLDSKVFINPTLVRGSRVKEFKKAYPALLDYFRKILLLLTKSNKPGDLFWRQARKMLQFSEIQGTCIGYSKSGTAGHGFGPKRRDELLDTLFQLVKKGITDPRLFELVSLFQDDVGCDLISDMVTYVLREQLYQFSDRVTKKLKLPFAQIRFESKKYNLPPNPHNDRPLIFLPEDILEDLPKALSWDDIDMVTRKNEEVRNAISKIIGYDWSKSSKKILKHEMKKLFLNQPKVLVKILKARRKKRSAPYNFAGDPAGLVSFHEAAIAYSKSEPLPLSLKTSPSLDDVYSVVKRICDDFKRAIDDNGCWKSLYYKYPKPLHEAYSQRLFQTIAEIRCSDNNLDLSPNSDCGRGPVDFKVSHGSKKVVVEVKLSRNRKLVDGYTKQLETYKKAENAQRAIYLVIEVGEPKPKLDKLIEVAATARAKDTDAPELYIVDGRRHLSASKL